ncbi:MAG: HAMP domain-containing protein, partial [Bacteroidota bacterium]|nr:HAMP domain-containing protein [Bacteroidota bacterium]
MRPKFLNKVSIKLILIISSVILLNLSVYTYYTISDLKQELTDINSQNAFNISDIIKKSTRYGMLLNRKEDIYQIINTIGTETGVARIRIYNKQGKINFSTDSSEVGKTVDTKDASCSICHSKAKLPSSLEPKEMIREFRNGDGKRVLGLINPIKNEKDCYTGSCHFHEQDKEILGVLDVMVTTEKIDAIVEANIRNILSNAVILTLLISVLTSIFIGIIVNKPLQDISVGIEEIAKGNLNYLIDIKSKDELGHMAAEFNVMSHKLDAAYKEIKDWNDTLNLKVKE